MEITYSKYGNYYLPDLVVSDEEPTTYGRFGRMRLRYLWKCQEMCSRETPKI